MMRASAALVLVLFAAVACADGLTGESPRPPRAGGAAPGGEHRYRATATVLENPDHGPEVCLGGIHTSYPPQCRGIPLTNWDWDRVDGEQRAAGTIWGEYEVTGAYDGERFTVADVGPPMRPPGEEAEFVTPCPEPEGGWRVPDPARAEEEHAGRALAPARKEVDFAGGWVDYTDEPTPGIPAEPGTIILNAAFTGDLDRHEAELRERWGGPLCVSRHPRSIRELERIRSELHGSAGAELGLEILSSSVSETRNVVEITVILADGETRRAVDERYGTGVVEVESALQPVS